MPRPTPPARTLLPVLFDDAETRRLNDLIADGARRWSAAELQWVREYAVTQRPPGYDTHCAVVVDLYLGDSEAHLLAAAKARFENRHKMMTPVTLNRMRHVASADSGVYRVQPDRRLVSRTTGEPLPDDAQRRFAALVDGMELGRLTPEVERRAIAVQTMFVRPRWVRGVQGKPGRIVGDLFWPRDVAVVCHPKDPGNFDSAMILLARTSTGGVASKKVWYSLWVREPEEQDGEVIGYTPWRVHLVSSEGEYPIPPDDPRTLYVDAVGASLPLPWTVVQLGQAEGSVYVTPDKDLPKFLLQLNVDASAERAGADLQAFTPVWYAGSERKEAELAWGPGEFTRVGEGEVLSTLQLDPKLDQLRAMRTQQEKELARVRGNNPNAYTTEASAESGVARLIAQAPHEAVLDENALVFRSWEEQQLWPAVLRLHDAYSGGVPFGDDAMVRVLMKRPAPIEDPETRVRRLQAEVDAGILSLAGMAVELGRFASVEDAKGRGLSDELGKKPASTSPLFSLGEPPAPAGGGRL